MRDIEPKGFDLIVTDGAPDEEGSARSAKCGVAGPIQMTSHNYAVAARGSHAMLRRQLDNLMANPSVRSVHQSRGRAFSLLAILTVAPLRLRLQALWPVAGAKSTNFGTDTDCLLSGQPHRLKVQPTDSGGVVANHLGGESPAADEIRDDAIAFRRG